MKPDYPTIIEAADKGWRKLWRHFKSVPATIRHLDTDLKCAMSTVDLATSSAQQANNLARETEFKLALAMESITNGEKQLGQAHQRIAELELALAGERQAIARSENELQTLKATHAQTLTQLESAELRREKEELHHSKTKTGLIKLLEWVHTTHRVASPPEGIRALFTAPKLVALFLGLAFSLAAQPAPVLRNSWSTNAPGTPVLGNNNLSVTNVGSGTNWLFYGILPQTIARLGDLTGGTNVLVQTNGANVGSIGTLNFTTGATGYVAGAVVNIGITAAGGGSDVWTNDGTFTYQTANTNVSTRNLDSSVFVGTNANNPSQFGARKAITSTFFPFQGITGTNQLQWDFTVGQVINYANSEWGLGQLRGIYDPSTTQNTVGLIIQNDGADNLTASVDTINRAGAYEGYLYLNVPNPGRDIDITARDPAAGGSYITLGSVFSITNDGNVNILRGVSYGWPTVQGAAGTVLTNNGSGVLGWSGIIDTKQHGSANLTNWSNIPTGAMANVVSTTFLTNWAIAISNLAQTKQTGSVVLSNLVGTVANNVTNVVSLSTTNATSKPLTNSYANGVLTLFGLEQGANITLTPNGSNIVVASTSGGSGFAALEIQTNDVRVGLQTNINFLTNAHIFVLATNNVAANKVDVHFDVQGNLADWALYPTNIWNSRQGGSAVLSNLVGTVANNVTNVVSLSTTNTTSKPLTNSYANGVLTLFGLEAGANVSLIPNASNIVIASTGSGGGLTTNATQFGPSVELTIKSGAFLTNLATFGMTNNGHVVIPTQPVIAGGAGIGLVDFSTGIHITNIASISTNFIFTNVNVGWQYLYVKALPGVTVTFIGIDGTNWTHGYIPDVPTNGSFTSIRVERQNTLTNLTMDGGIALLGAAGGLVLHTNFISVPPVVTVSNSVSPSGSGFAALEIQTNDIRVGLQTNINFVTNANIAVFATNNAAANKVDVQFNVQGNLADWALYPTNVWNSRQGGSPVLSNLVGTVANNVTNFISLSTTNATSKPLTNSYTAGVLTMFGLEAGANITLTPNESNIVVASTASGGGLSTNANQFGEQVVLTIQEGALLTNTLFYPSNLTGPATIHSASVGQMTNLTEWRATNATIPIAISSNGYALVYTCLQMSNAVAFRTNNIDFRLNMCQAFTNALQTNLVLQLTNTYEGVTHRIDAYGAGRLGNGRTNAWQLLCTAASGITIYWPPGSTNGNFDVLVNSNQVVSFTFMGGLGSTNILAAYRVMEGIGAN